VSVALAPALAEDTRRAVVCHDGVGRNAIRAALELADVRLEAETDLCGDAFGVIGAVTPHVVVLDLTVAGASALAMVPRIHSAAPEAGVVAVAPPWMVHSVSRAARDAAVDLFASSDIDGLRAAVGGLAAAG
jgi:DNA-binding NtrC family response regulator